MPTYMTNDEFVRQFKMLKDELSSDYSREDSGNSVMALIKELQLDNRQKLLMNKIIGAVLADTIYTILLGLDGCASIGDIQQPYKIYTKDGKPIDGAEDIESCAWKYFHNHDGI